MDRQLLQALNQAYPIEFYHIKAVTNEMYKCQAQQGDFFVRITNYKSAQEQLEEVRYSNYLLTQGLRVSEAVPSFKNKLVEQLTLDENKLAVVFKAAPGSHMARKEWQSSVLRETGRLIGKMHRATMKYLQTEKATHIHHWHQNDEYDFLKHIPKEEKAIRQKAADITERIKQLPQSPSNYGIIHGDVLLENILVDQDDQMTLVDFQDCEKHFYMYDLIVPIYSSLEFSFSGGQDLLQYKQQITDALLEGYQEFIELDQQMIDAIPLFMQLKQIFEYNLMHMYWDIDSLSEEQIRILNMYRWKIENNYCPSNA